MNKNNNDIDEAVLVIIIVVCLVAVVISYTIRIFFYLTLSRCLSRVQPRNRDMEPGQVWLNLIPCFELVWIFFTIVRIANSLRREHEDRGWHTEGETFGQNIGVAYAILALLAGIPYIGSIFGIVAFICFIMYWVQIAAFSRRLADEPYDRTDRFDDDYDDRKFRDRDDLERDRDPDARFRR